MQDLRTHERFEIEVLSRMNSHRLLAPLVFGGGTMLRLCYDLNRYSADLDFWLIKEIAVSRYHDTVSSFLGEEYLLSDAADKKNTLVYEFRSPAYPRHLKIEIRKIIRDCRWKETIAFSRYSNIQVLVKAMTLEQMMRNKIEALLDRQEIRDCFDIEFMLRKGTPLKASRKELEGVLKTARSFKSRDFSVTLGSLLEKESREYYRNTGFEYLIGTVTSLLTR